MIKPHYYLSIINIINFFIKYKLKYFYFFKKLYTGIAALNTKLGILNIQISPAVVPAYMYSPLGSTIAFVYVLINPELGN